MSKRDTIEVMDRLLSHLRQELRFNDAKWEGMAGNAPASDRLKNRVRRTAYLEFEIRCLDIITPLRVEASLEDAKPFLDKLRESRREALGFRLGDVVIIGSGMMKGESCIITAEYDGGYLGRPFNTPDAPEFVLPAAHMTIDRTRRL